MNSMIIELMCSSMYSIRITLPLLPPLLPLPLPASPFDSHTEMVAYRFLEEVELTDLERGAAIPLCKHFHQSTRELSEQFAHELGRHNYVTPTSYLELISSFKSVLSNKRGDVLKMKKRYEVGLEKLKFAASQVYTLGVWCSPIVCL